MKIYSVCRYSIPAQNENVSIYHAWQTKVIYREEKLEGEEGGEDRRREEGRTYKCGVYTRQQVTPPPSNQGMDAKYNYAISMMKLL